MTQDMESRTGQRGRLLSLPFQPFTVNPFQVAELGKSDVMGLHAVRQYASFDLIPDCGIILSRIDPVSRLIFIGLEMDDFQEHRNPGVESNVDEHAEGMNGYDPACHPTTTG
jgi:hypothetical protein